MSHLKQIQPLISWEELFNNNHPLELEIGMGRAYYLFERAKACPNHNIVGIEYKKTFVEQANAKKQREHISNAHAIWGNAWHLVPDIFQDNSLVNVTVNFPDPWWKKRHHKRRIINPHFTAVLFKKLKSNGSIFLQTDVSALFESYLEILSSYPNLIQQNKESDPFFENPMNAKSHREKKCEELGIPIYRAFFVKN